MKLAMHKLKRERRIADFEKGKLHREPEGSCFLSYISELPPVPKNVKFQHNCGLMNDCRDDRKWANL